MGDVLACEVESLARDRYTRLFMSARAIGSATISFGLVAIPVKIFPASKSTGIAFNMLHAKCGTRVKQQYVCPLDEEIVPREAMIKGYEFAKGQYVTFEADELKALAEPATQSIEIKEFIPQDQVPTIYYDRPFYLGPDKNASRPYRLLSRALTQTGRAAVARHAARGKQYLVLLAPYGDGLIMYQLHHKDEIRAFDEVPIGEAAPKAKEVDLAVQLIDQTASDTFKPGDYPDEVQQRIEQAVEQKLEGKEVVISDVAAPQAQIIDLMEALKASIGHGKSPKGKAGAKSGKGASRKPPKRAVESQAATKTKPKKRARSTSK